MNELDDLFEDHIKRFIQKVEAVIRFSEETTGTKATDLAFITTTPLVEFLSELEWNLMKLQLGIKSDAHMIAYVETHPYFKDKLVPRLGSFKHELYPTDTRTGMFCVINLELSI